MSKGGSGPLGIGDGAKKREVWVVYFCNDTWDSAACVNVKVAYNLLGRERGFVQRETIVLTEPDELELDSVGYFYQ